MAWSLFDQTAVSPLSWAQSELQQLGDPLTSADEQSLIAWALLEGGGGTYNPLNTSLPEPGSSKFNSSGVQNYTSWAQGVEAIASTIDESTYTQIKADLASGKGIGPTTELDTWSGGGYGSLSATWGEAAQYMSGVSQPLPASSTSSNSASSGTSAFNLKNPLTWFTGIADLFAAGAANEAEAGLVDILERGALMLFGAVLVVIGIVRLTGGSENKVTLESPVAQAGEAAAETAAVT
jgi:hypothetical protein